MTVQCRRQTVVNHTTPAELVVEHHLLGEDIKNVFMEMRVTSSSVSRSNLMRRWKRIEFSWGHLRFSHTERRDQCHVGECHDKYECSSACRCNASADGRDRELAAFLGSRPKVTSKSPANDLAVGDVLGVAVSLRHHPRCDDLPESRSRSSNLNGSSAASTSRIGGSRSGRPSTRLRTSRAVSIPVIPTCRE